MRFNAPLLVAALVAVNVPFSALAESITTDGVTFYYGSDSALSDPYAAQPVYGYGESVAYDGTMIIEEAPMMYDDSSALSYDVVDSAAAWDQTGSVVMTETIDGVVYETVGYGDAVPVMEDVQIIQTY